MQIIPRRKGMALVGRDLSCPTAAKWGLGETIGRRPYEIVPNERKRATAANKLCRAVANAQSPVTMSSRTHS
jgi:hypothetical protein